jgi:hypothetical protein
MRKIAKAINRKVQAPDPYISWKFTMFDPQAAKKTGELKLSGPERVNRCKSQSELT